jgi:hypothetical protein
VSIINDWISRFAWPDISTEEGVGRARSIGAAALLWIAFTYVLAWFSVFSGGNLVGGGSNEDGLRIFALCGLGGAVAATTYLAVRIKIGRCPLAAWVGFIWIAYEALNALLDITPNNPAIFLILSFAAFQGVRGCMSRPNMAGER